MVHQVIWISSMSKDKTCQVCKGNGRVWVVLRDIDMRKPIVFDYDVREEECRACNGTGKTRG